MPGETESFVHAESTPVEASFVVISEDDTFAPDDDNATNNSVDVIDNNGNQPKVAEPIVAPPNQMAPLSISQGTSGSERLVNKRLSSQSSLTMSVDQIRSSLMLHATEINPEIIIDRLVNLLGENRKLRQAVKQHNDNLERATHIIVKLRKEKSQLEESDKKNYDRTKKLVENLRTKLEEKTKALATVETEVAELKRFRVDAANWQQQCESTQKLLQEQEEEFKSHRLKLKELERAQEEEQEAASSKRSSTTSSEPSTPSSNENYLEMVNRVSDLEQDNMALESQLSEAAEDKTRYEAKWIETDTKLSRMMAREKQSEQEALGLRDTIAAYKNEIENLRKELTELKSENENLIEDANVKDLMDEAQRKISTVTLVDQGSRGPESGEEAYVYDSHFGGGGRNDNSGIAAERRSFLEALERSREQQKEMEISLAQMEAQMREQNRDMEKEVQERVKEKLETELAKMSSSSPPKSVVNRSESHPPQHTVNGNKEIASLRKQVISLVEELKQKETRLDQLKSEGDQAEQRYKMLKTQMEMEETKTKSQLTMLQQALEESEIQLQREKAEVGRTQTQLMDAKRDSEEKDTLLRYLDANPNARGGTSLMVDQEKEKLRMEIDRLTAMQFTAEDAISEKDNELSKARQEMAKLRAKLDDNAYLQAQVQVYKEDFNQEQRMRELMAQEKEKVLRENQQLQDQISVLNDMLQPQGRGHPESMLQQQPTSQQQRGRNAEARPRANMNEIDALQHRQGLSYTAARPSNQRSVVPSSQTPSVGTNPRHYQNQQNLQHQQHRQYQQQTRGFAGNQQQQQYPLTDREAASLMGRHLLGDAPSLSCPFQGVEDVSPGAFSNANIPNVQSDGARASPAPSLSQSPRTKPSVSPNEFPAVNVTEISLPAPSASSPQLQSKTPNPPSRSESGSSNATLAAKNSNASPSGRPTGLSTSSMSLSQSMEEEDWQIQFGSCPKCQLRFYELEMLQMHVLECLDIDSKE